MTMTHLLSLALALATTAHADPVHFQTNDPDGRMAVAARTDSNDALEHEAGDDFVLSDVTRMTSASFTGLFADGADPEAVQSVVVEIYRVFPFDSVDPPSGHVPTRSNSPSDVAFDRRDSSYNGLSYHTVIVSPTFYAANSVVNGIHAAPNQTTGGEGAVSGEEVRFNVEFVEPLVLPAGHYFFVPQVATSYGEFLWLSAPKPIVVPGTPFDTDLQAWVRDGNLAPDWLRVGTDIVGGDPPPTFNLAFSLDGTTDGTVHFQTNDPDGAIAMATHPEASSEIETETGDDFVLPEPAHIRHATFTGIVSGTTAPFDIAEVVVEIYRVFPFDSVDPPSGRVPTRTKSPSDVAFDTREGSKSQLDYTALVINQSFSAANSVLDGIHALPYQTTHGDGPVSGEEVVFDVKFDPPFELPAGHYFFVPQVSVANGDFFWLSAPKPIVVPGTPFDGDLQAWIRNENLDPDWLRVGTDIVGGDPAPTFNATFSLDGDTDVVFRNGFDPATNQILR
ncbi:MAG: hypothetical protein ABI843_09090 [Dokdonella sp.]